MKISLNYLKKPIYTTKYRRTLKNRDETMMMGLYGREMIGKKFA